MRSTKYVDDCCRSITAAREYPTDVYLVQLVRLHCLVDRISRALSPDDFNSASQDGFWSTPIAMAVKALETDLRRAEEEFKLDIVMENQQGQGHDQDEDAQSYRPSQPHSLASDLALVCKIHCDNVRLFLYGIALEDLDGLRNPWVNGEPGSTTNMRLPMIVNLVHSLVPVFDTICSWPTRSFFNVPFSVFAIYSHAALILAKLCVLSPDNVPGWDESYLQRYGLDIVSILQAVESKYADISRQIHSPLEIERDSFRRDGRSVVSAQTDRVVSRLRCIREVFESRRKIKRHRHSHPQQQLQDQQHHQYQHQHQRTLVEPIQQQTLDRPALNGYGQDLPSMATQNTADEYSGDPSATLIPSVHISPEELLEMSVTGAGLFDYLDDEFWRQLV
ncbi:hypothetical protein A1O3_04963 [Capronia epimyces CBS 606.96]|uniref:Transcription factor domain-containing protein n=1 Tax=Capronia epimyces CBS 606.96 TaxID=1182542 RepID=W9Y4Z6_9EURO|nr:uncharacterized protein A1O3_04963 [Capronia epimyces CBS 606.96]EXJ84296.1 hypothetical protein A1O3_04963 [Capronia epimyces CBS 606.96]